MSVTVKIGGSIAGLKAALAKGKQEVGGWAKSVKGLLAGVGVALGARWITRQFTQLVDRLDTLGKKARGLGVTAEEMQKIEYAAESAGVPMEKVSGAFTRMLDTLADARNGSKQAVDALAKLGMTVEDFNGLSSYQSFEKIVRALGMIADPAKRANAAMDIFGKGLAQNTAFFADFEKAVLNLQNSGQLIPDEAVANAEKIKQASLDIERAWNSILVKTGAVAYLADKLKAIAEVANAGEEVSFWKEVMYQAIRLSPIALAFPGGEPDPSKSKVGMVNGTKQVGSTAPTVDEKEGYKKSLEATRELQKAIDAMNAQRAAEASAAAAGKTSRATSAGADRVLTDNIRRIGGNLGYNYAREQSDYQKAAAEAAQRAAEAMEDVRQNGVTLKG